MVIISSSPPDVPPTLVPPVLTQFDKSALCAPSNVSAPAIGIDELNPPFLTSEWLTECVSDICQLYCKQDKPDGTYRKPPMALVRCSRGGKSRALCEIAHALHLKLPDAAIICISLNNATELSSWEPDDPVGAVCRRIAFAAQLVASTLFDTFRVHVSRVDIETWLGGLPCILLVDELNGLAALRDRSHPKCTEIGTFLMEVFLKPVNRYLIFSSHTVSLNSRLSDCIDSSHGRQIQIRQLPLIARLVMCLRFLFISHFCFHQHP